MKKVLAMILALMLVLGTTAAFAEISDTSKEIKATYTKADPTLVGTEAYSLEIAWGTIAPITVSYTADEYEWDASELKYTLKEAGTVNTEASKGTFTVTISNRGNKAASVSLDFTAVDGVTVTTTGDTGTVASAAPVFDPTNPEATGSTKTCSLSTTVTVTEITETIRTAIDEAKEAVPDGEEFGGYKIGTLILTIA